MNNSMSENVGRKIVEALKMQDTDSEQVFDAASDEYTNPSVNVSITEQTINNEIPVNTPPTFSEQTFELNDIDCSNMPANIVILKQLISRLPAGVTKQTGATIIKQTMEALGITMKSVLVEAQRFQDGLNNSINECKNSIVEHNKQIELLEKQTQQYQKQYAMLNDVVSLFIQTNI